jgi:hypothetical protein
MARDLKGVVDLAVVAHELDGLLQVQGGHIAYDGMSSFDDFVHIVAASSIDQSICEVDRLVLARKAIFAAGETGQVTKDNLQSSIAKVVRAYSVAPRSPFVYVSSISRRYSQDLTNITLNGVHVTFTSHLPKRFDRSHAARVLNKGDGRAGRGFAFVRVCVSSRSVPDAFEEAAEVLDFKEGCGISASIEGYGSRAHPTLPRH